IWLCWIVGRQSGASGMAMVLAGALALALALWLWRFGTLARCGAAVAAAVAVMLLANPLLQGGGQQAVAANEAGATAYRAETLAQLRDSGRPVFLNVTADWCLTCLANERVALGSDTVRE